MDKLNSPWAMRFECTDHGDWCVLQGAADYCAEHGHAFYIVDGVDRGHCPRCGVRTDNTDTNTDTNTDDDTDDDTDGDTDGGYDVYVSHNLRACVCCLVKLANDEACHCWDGAHPDGLAAFNGVPSSVHLVPGDDWDGFDTAPCAGCGTVLAGERHDVVGLSDLGRFVRRPELDTAQDEWWEWVADCTQCGDPIDYCQGHGDLG